MLFVAAIDHHVVHAIDADTGKPRWTFHAGGRVDSSPTYHAGRLLFGSTDGYVYCLRASDGELAWRFRAAPADRRMVAFERVESVWPVHGSVLVQDGTASFVAGRSMYLDGGLRMCRLEAATGRLLGEQVLDDRDPETGDDLQVRVKGLNMPVALPDILSSNGEHLFMRSQVMDLEGKRLKLGPAGSGTPHLFAPYGFTDDSWFHRTYWVFGDSFKGGVGGFGNGKTTPAGRILVYDESTVFGYGRKPQYYRWGSAIDYHLYAATKPGSPSQRGEELVKPSGLSFGRTSSLDPAGKAITIAAWVRPDAPDGTILVRGANVFGFALVLTDRKPRMLLRMKGKTHEVVGSEPIGKDWTHVAGVLRKDGRMEVYTNGRTNGSTRGVPLINGNPAIAMKVGYDDTHQLLPDPLAPFSGALDEVRLYYRALSPEQLAQLASRPPNAGLDDDADLVLRLTFANRVGQDGSRHGNHGRASGKLQTVDGPAGKALLLKQPAQLTKLAARPRPRKRRRRSAVNFLWTRDVPVMVRAMALAGDRLLIAGPADVLDEDAAFQSFGDEGTQEQLLAQDAALRGRSGGICQTIDASTGKTLAELRLDSPPVFDGLIVSAGRVYIATMDGAVVCLK